MTVIKLMHTQLYVRRTGVSTILLLQSDFALEIKSSVPKSLSLKVIKSHTYNVFLMLQKKVLQNKHIDLFIGNRFQEEHHFSFFILPQNNP